MSSGRKTKKYQAAIETVTRLYNLDPESFAAWTKTGRYDAIYRLLEKLQYEWTGVEWRLQEPVWIRRYKRLNEKTTGISHKQGLGKDTPV